MQKPLQTPPPRANWANTPELGVSPQPLHRFGSWKLCWIACFFCKENRRKNLVGGSQLSLNVRGKIQTPLLTHCTNLCPVNFKGLDHLYRNSGVNLGILYGAEVAQAEIAACNEPNNSTKF